MAEPTYQELLDELKEQRAKEVREKLGKDLDEPIEEVDPRKRNMSIMLSMHIPYYGGESFKTIIPASFTDSIERKERKETRKGRWDIHFRNAGTIETFAGENIEHPEQFLAIYQSNKKNFFTGEKKRTAVIGARNDKLMDKTLDAITKKSLEQRLISVPPPFMSNKFDYNFFHFYIHSCILGLPAYLATIGMCAGAALPLIKNGNILAGAAVAGFPFYGGFVLGGVNMINGVADKLRDKSLDKEALDFRFGPEAIQDMTTETHNLRLANTYKQALDKGYFMEENQWKNVHDKIANSPWDYGKLTYVNWEENKQALRLEIMYAGLNKIIPRILMHDKEKIYDIIKIVLGEDGKQFCDPDYNPCAGCCDCKEK